MLANRILSACGGTTEEKLYVDDVFSTYLYTGNGSTQTINNGIDLAGKGGMVWIKHRSGGSSSNTRHQLVDSARGAGNALCSDSSSSDNGAAVSQVSALNSNGFSVTYALNGTTNALSDLYASWTFRKAPKFFDVVTYTGDGVAGRQIPHSLGVTPGMVIVKDRTVGYHWAVWHRNLPHTNGWLSLNQSVAEDYTFYTNMFGSAPDFNTSTFTVGPQGNTNGNGQQFVAYLFAHDPSADGIIQCGSFSASSGHAYVNIGFEPQFVMYKKTNAAGDWKIIDTMRRWDVYNSVDGGYGARLFPNLTNAESNGPLDFEITLTNNGFRTPGIGASDTYIYLAIRRPNKPPTTGAQVYNGTASSASTGVIASGFTTDFAMALGRNAGNGAPWERLFYDRLRGNFAHLCSADTTAEGSNTSAVSFAQNNGILLNGGGIFSSGYVYQQFRRAPGFFDVVCYTGTGSATARSHSLSAAPELIILKKRSSYDGSVGTNWGVWANPVSSGSLFLNGTFALSAPGGPYLTMSVTSTTFTDSNFGQYWNTSGNIFVAYLFATLPGISKVGSYTGNGSSQTIGCGFATGARFILIKRTDSTGDWYVWDSARGIVAANDPHLSLNTIAAEVTTDDSVDPDNSGFIVNQVAATNINVTGASYIFLAIS